MKELKNLRAIWTKQQEEEVSRLIEQGNREPELVLRFLDESITLLQHIEGFSEKKIRDLVEITRRGGIERLFDKLAEIQVLRRLYEHGVRDICWEPVIGRGRADILFEINGKRIYMEITRLQKGWIEAQREAQLRCIEEAISRIKSPFFVSIFLEDDMAGEPRELSTQLAGRIIHFCEEKIRELFGNEKQMRQLKESYSQYWKAQDEKVERAASQGDFEKVIDILMEPSEFGKEFSLDPIEKDLGSFTVDLRRNPEQGTECRCNMPLFHQIGGKLSEKFWYKIEKEVKQLPNHDIGLLFFWVDSEFQTELDLVAPTFHVLRGLKGTSRTMSSQLAELFKKYRERLSGVIYHSGWMSRLYCNPVANNRIDSSLELKLREALGL